MLPNKAECYGDGYEGCDGDEPQACSDGASGLSCIEYDHQKVCTPKKNTYYGACRMASWK